MKYAKRIAKVGLIVGMFIPGIFSLIAFAFGDNIVSGYTNSPIVVERA